MKKRSQTPNFNRGGKKEVKLPRQNDSPDQDLYHDDNRPNLYGTDPGRSNQAHRVPMQDDSPDKDENHDDNRRNLYDAEVGQALKGGQKEKQKGQ